MNLTKNIAFLILIGFFLKTEAVDRVVKATTSIDFEAYITPRTCHILAEGRGRLINLGSTTAANIKEGNLSIVEVPILVRDCQKRNLINVYVTNIDENGRIPLHNSKGEELNNLFIQIGKHDDGSAVSFEFIHLNQKLLFSRCAGNHVCDADYSEDGTSYTDNGRKNKVLKGSRRYAYDALDAYHKKNIDGNLGYGFQRDLHFAVKYYHNGNGEIPLGKVNATAELRIEYS